MWSGFCQPRPRLCNIWTLTLAIQIRLLWRMPLRSAKSTYVNNTFRRLYGILQTLTAILMTTSGEKILEKLNTESTHRDLEDNEGTKYYHLEFFTSKFGRSCLALTPHFDVNDQQSTGADNANMLFSEEMWMKNGFYFTNAKPILKI